MPRLTEYLLKLATDVKELKKFKKVRDKSDKSLTAYLTRQPRPGLSASEARALEKCDSVKILDAVMKELEKASSNPSNPFYGISITFTCEINQIETGTGRGHPGG